MISFGGTLTSAWRLLFPSLSLSVVLLACLFENCSEKNSLRGVLLFELAGGFFALFGDPTLRFLLVPLCCGFTEVALVDATADVALLTSLCPMFWWVVPTWFDDGVGSSVAVLVSE